MTGKKEQGKWVPFGCSQCGVGPDPARAWVVDGVMVKVEGNPAYRDKWPTSSLVCGVCYSAAQKLYNPHRIKAPMKRTNPKKGINEDPKFVEIGWDEALNILVEKLKEVRAKGLLDENKLPRVAVAAGRPIARTFEGHGWAALWRAFGPVDTDMRNGAGVKCTHSLHILGELWYRSFIDIADYKYCNYELDFGQNSSFNARRSGSSAGAIGIEARARGMRQVMVCPALNQTGGRADEWVPIRVKTDAAFVFGMIHTILHEMEWRKTCDVDFLKKMTNSPYLVGPHGYYVRDAETGKPLVWDPSAGGQKIVFEAKDFALDGTYDVKGIEKGPDGETFPVEKAKPAFQLLVEHVKQYTPEWASKITDVPAETIRRIAREFATHAMVGATVRIEGKELPLRPVATALGRGTENGWGAYELVWARMMLQVLFGAVEVPGSILGTDSMIYKFIPFERDADGFPSAFFQPTARGKWTWPPKSRCGNETLTPLSGPDPMTFGALHLAWKSFLEPLDKWPVSVPDVFVMYRCNPVVTQYNSNLIRKGLEIIPFVASFAFTMNESNWYADLLLPDAPDFESCQLSQEIPAAYKGHTHRYYGYFLRQPIVRTQNDTRDLTDVTTELADRLGILPAYNMAINGMNRLMGTPFQLAPQQKYTVDEIVDRLCKSVTKGEHGLDWFKETGGILWPASELKSYLHINMVEKGMRYELPYMGRVKVVGEELVRRLHEVGINWWDRQAHAYTRALPDWEDFPARYKEVFQKTPDYNMWLICHRTQLMPGCENQDIPINVDIAKDVLDFPGVLVNTETARGKGIRDGDRVCLETAFGKVYCDAVLSETVRPDVLVILGFGHYITPVSSELKLPNTSELQTFDIRLTSEDGSASEHTLVKLYKA